MLATPLDLATHDVVMTKDSNITLVPESVGAFMASLTPEVGLVCAVPVSVRADGLSGQIEAMLVNGHARLLLTASSLGLGFGVGKVMLFRRSDYVRAGGFDALAHTIAEDTANVPRHGPARAQDALFAHVTAAQGNRPGGPGARSICAKRDGRSFVAGRSRCRFRSNSLSSAGAGGSRRGPRGIRWSGCRRRQPGLGTLAI